MKQSDEGNLNVSSWNMKCQDRKLKRISAIHYQPIKSANSESIEIPEAL